MRHWITATAVVLLLFAHLGTASASGFMLVNQEGLEEMMGDGAQLTIVDVREPYLFRRGHIPGAINIPYDDAHGRILNELSPEERIVFVCHGGPMGDELAQILVRNGYKRVYNLRGGMRWWRGPLEKGER